MEGAHCQQMKLMRVSDVPLRKCQICSDGECCWFLTASPPLESIQLSQSADAVAIFELSAKLGIVLVDVKREQGSLDWGIGHRVSVKVQHQAIQRKCHARQRQPCLPRAHGVRGVQEAVLDLSKDCRDPFLSE